MPHKTEAEFEIESDARTLVEAQMIRQDDKRSKPALALIEKKMAASKAALNKS